MVDKMGRKIAIVHYHLRRGGVTRVIEAAREAMESRGHEVLILSGEPPLGDAKQVGVRVVSALNYRKTGSSVVAENLAEKLKQEAKAHFGDLPDVWHFHNPTLAKNVMIPTVIRELANEGERIVLQLHDFAEDGRPSNYTSQRSFFDSESSFEETLYPTARQIHYATINCRDHDFLRAAGVKEKNVHVIANAIPELRVRTKPEDRPFSKDKLFALYPTRGIRRKNIGELLLLALIYGDRVDFATTLSPDNPEWKETHEMWRDAISELDLPVSLGVADDGKQNFFDLLGWSDFIVTTSIGEGFGLAFLEPWIIGKCVIGRDLPEITRDFSKNGVRLDGLYKRIDIPIEWLDMAALESEVESMLRRSYLAYDCGMPKGAVKQTLKAWIKDKRIDFGVLNEGFQIEILRKLKSDVSLLDQIAIPPLSLSTKREIDESSEAVRSAYNLERYGVALDDMYTAVAQEKIGKVKHLATKKVLKQFLHPKRLNLLRN